MNSSSAIYILSGACLVLSLLGYLVFRKQRLGFILFASALFLMSAQQLLIHKNTVMAALFALAAFVWAMKAVRNK